MTTPRWYMVDKMGMATLCTSKKDAEKEARAMDMAWPHMGPHRAVQLVDAADVEAMRAGYAAARLEIESLRKEHADELTVAYMCGASREKELAAQQEPSCTSVQLAEMVLSDCGHSSNYVPLLERVAARIDAHVERCLESKKTTQQEAQEPVAWYVTGCGRLLDEDKAKAEARHIGGTARAIPLYTAPQADSVTAPAAGAVAHTISDAQIEAMPVWRNFVGLWPESRREIVDAVVDLLAAAPTTQPAPQHEAQEPVAWRVHPFDYGVGSEGVYAMTALTQQRDVWERRGWKTEPLYTASQPSPTAQGDALDAERLDWLTFNLSGKALRDIGVVWSEHGDARRAIDAARAAQEGK